MTTVPDWNALSDADFKSRVAAFVETHCPRTLRHLGRRPRWSEVCGWYTTLGRHGWLAPGWPTAHGGMGLHAARHLLYIEEMERCGAPWMPDSGVRNLGPVLISHGSDAQKRHWLPRMARGEVIAAIGMTEPGAGSDLAALRTRAVLEGEGDAASWRIDGQKIFISNGQLCDLLLLAARTDPDASRGAKGVSLLLVPTDRPGFDRGRKLDKLGMQAQDTSELFFDGLRVPADHLLGEPGRGFALMMQELPQERLLVAITAVGAMEAAVVWTREHVKQRRAFGAALADKQTIRHRLAEVHADTRVARAFLDDCLRRHLQGTLDTATASIAKYWCTEMQFSVLDRCLQLFGGYGYMREYPIARAWADARVQRIYGGTNEIMKEIVARDLLGGR